MPELPEVETVRRGLEDILRSKPVIEKVRLMRGDIRFPIPKNLPKTVEGQPFIAVRRRAKYLLLDTPKASLLSHLGMTGSWRLAKKGEEDKHDHCYIELSNGSRLAFRDPRRFGVLDLVRTNEEEKHKLLKHLGPEPLDEEKFTGDYLFEKSRKRTTAAKVFLMDQKIVVGIGNIYASEVFFRARVKPTRLTGKLTRAEANAIVEISREILNEAIRSGGSSIRDYKGADGESGGFQNSHLVYDRGDSPCTVCGASIRSQVLGGRSTYWCTKCQR